MIAGAEKEAPLAAVTPGGGRGMDPGVFRAVAGHFASGVTVISTASGGVLHGTTASAVASLSMEPPMMLVCLNRSSTTNGAIRQARAFAVNILAEGQDDLALRFGRKQADKFSGVPHRPGHGGVPLIEGALATIECATAETVEGGTHTVFLADVVAATSRDDAPLTYFRGGFGRLERAREQTAYRNLRRWILDRNVPAGGTLDADRLASDLDANGEHVVNALIRLSAEAVVNRQEDGSFVAAPITYEAAARFFDARTAMVAGVVDAHLGRLRDAGADELLRLAGRVGDIHADPAGSLGAFLSAVDDFHAELVGLAGSPPLAAAHFRLGVHAVWREALSLRNWREIMNPEGLMELAVALAARDREAAVRAIYRHGHFVKDLAARVIAERGGSV